MNSLSFAAAQGQSQPSNEVFINVIVKQEHDGKVIAMVLGMPELLVEASDRTTALAQLQQRLEMHLAVGEIVPLLVKLPQPQRHNPWLEMAGIFKDDPQFDQMLEAIATYRHEIDAQDDEYSRKADALPEES